MAAKKRPKIGDFLGLEWDKQEPEIPESADTCSFCGGDISVREEYFHGLAPSTSVDPGMLLFVACTRCVTGAGIKW